jgi:chromatin assembly factor 1 subunit A
MLVVFAISGSCALADPPGKEEREARKAEMEYDRDQSKREREWEREERKHYQELEREERKHQEEMAREERKHQEEMWREGGYGLDERGYEYGVDDSYEPEYIEDKVQRIIKDVRDLTNLRSQ